MPLTSRTEELPFAEEAEARMQELAEFLGRDTRVNLALVTQLHDRGMVLTPGAFLMLVVPLLEATRLEEQLGPEGATEPGLLPPDIVRESIGKLLDAMRSDPSSIDRRLDAADVTGITIPRRPTRKDKHPEAIRIGPRGKVRSSLSVARALGKWFGRVPPYGE